MQSPFHPSSPSSPGDDPEPHAYTLRVETANIIHAGTDHAVSLTISGDQSVSPALLLRELPSKLIYFPGTRSTPTPSPTLSLFPDAPSPAPSAAPSAPTSTTLAAATRQPSADKFLDQGTVREFTTDLPYLGNVIRVRLQLHVEGHHVYEAAWRPARVTVTDEALHRSWAFVVKGWVNADAGHVVDVDAAAEVAAGRRAAGLSGRRLSIGRAVIPEECGFGGGDADGEGGGGGGGVFGGIRGAEGAPGAPGDVLGSFARSLQIFKAGEGEDFAEAAEAAAADLAAGLGGADGDGAGKGDGEPAAGARGVGAARRGMTRTLSRAEAGVASSSAADAGVRRVCFSVKKFDREGYGMYLVGDTKALGAWHPENGLRMTMVTGRDGSFRGEWRLEVEMDDTSEIIEYGYVVVCDPTKRFWWEGRGGKTGRERARVLRLGASEVVGGSGSDGFRRARSAEGGVIYCDDTFDPETRIVHHVDDRSLYADEEVEEKARELRERQKENVLEGSQPQPTQEPEAKGEGREKEDVPGAEDDVALPAVVSFRSMVGESRIEGGAETISGGGGGGGGSNIGASRERELGESEDDEDDKDGASRAHRDANVQDGGIPCVVGVEEPDVDAREVDNDNGDHAENDADDDAGDAGEEEDDFFGADERVETPPTSPPPPATYEEAVRQLRASRRGYSKQMTEFVAVSNKCRLLESRLRRLGIDPASGAESSQSVAVAAAAAAAVAAAGGVPENAGTSPVSSSSSESDTAEQRRAGKFARGSGGAGKDEDVVPRKELADAIAAAKAREEELSARLAAAEACVEDARGGCEEVEGELADLRATMVARVEEFETANAEFVSRLMDAQESRRAEVQQMQEERALAMQRWAAEYAQRRRLFNLVQELRGNIRVFCRVRPPKQGGFTTADGALDMSALPVRFPDLQLAGGNVAMSSALEVGEKRFDFDHVFPPQSSQEQVYEETAGVVGSVLDGYNVCVFAYGQTGSGKTHTMNGTSDDPGVNFRALSDLFSIVGERSEHSDYEISVSMMEIYNEILRDLIYDAKEEDDGGDGGAPSAPPKLEIRKQPTASSPNAVYVPNLTSVGVKSVDDVWTVMERGARNRSQHATDMNEHSSRSHLILSVNVVAVNRVNGIRTTGALSLVDLAGSERLSRSKAAGERLKEAQHINKSLATLGDVFMALVEKSPHIPYRNSKLTYLLQESIGGDSKTLMFVNTSCDEADVGETLSSLQFAQRVARVERGAATVHSSGPGASGLKGAGASGSSAGALHEKDAQIAALQAKLASSERDTRKRAEENEDLRRQAATATSNLKETQKAFGELKRRDGTEKVAANASAAAAARELKELRSADEKAKTELRAAKNKVREVTLSKDDEIKRLKAALDDRDVRLRRLQLEQKGSSVGQRSTASSRNLVPGVGATPRPVSRARLPARTGAGARTFASGDSRKVRFPSPTSLATELSTPPPADVTPSLSASDGTGEPPVPADEETGIAGPANLATPGNASSPEEEGLDAGEWPSSDAAAADASAMPPPPIPATPTRQAGPGDTPLAPPRRRTTIPRAATASSVRAGRASGIPSIGGAGGPARKRVVYAFGSRVETEDGPSSAGSRPATTGSKPSGLRAPGGSRPARSTPNLRPAQRRVTSALGTETTPQSGAGGGGDTPQVVQASRPTPLAGSGPRRAGSFHGVSSQPNQ